MIKKTLYICLGVVVSAIIALNACSSKAQAVTSEQSLNESQSDSRYQREQKSVWETDLADKSRFTLNFKLNASEKALAKKFARTVTSNLKKNDVYVHYLLSKLKEGNVPLEFASIPLMESGLNPNVHNKGAHGPWQYVRSTGKSLGLQRTRGYDGVYDFFASTDAGIKYLKRLYKHLGDWQLVVVAYNRGEYGVRKAMDAARRKGLEPTIGNIAVSRAGLNYLAKFKAFSDILKRPTAYGVKLPNIKNRSAFRKVEVAGKVRSLNEAAEMSGASIETIRKLNSGYTTDRIDRLHGLKMPIEHADELEKAVYNSSYSKLSDSTEETVTQ